MRPHFLALRPPVGYCLPLLLLTGSPTAASHQAPPFEAHLNCAGPDYQAWDGTKFLADQPYEAGGFGYDGGSPGTPVGEHSLQERRDRRLYSTTRDAMTAYRFDVDESWYAVTLHLAELEFHGQGLRQFNVAIEDESVINQLDLTGLAGPHTSVVFKFSVEVLDGTLDVTFDSDFGVPTLAAISVIEISQANPPPDTPSDFQIMDGLGMVVCSWDARSNPLAARHRIFRSVSPEGPFDLIAEPLHCSGHYYDHDVPPGITHYYQVEQVDVFGRTSLRTQINGALAHGVDDSNLPVYDLNIAREELDRLDADIWSDDYVSAVLTTPDDTFEIGVRYRGAKTRYAPKKSWRIKLNEGSFKGTDELILNSTWGSSFLISDNVGLAYFDSTSVHHSNTDLIHLRVNGHYYGVYTNVEIPNYDFFVNRGEAEVGDLYKCASPFEPGTSPEDWALKYDNKTHDPATNQRIQEFVESLNDLDDEALPEWIADQVNLDRLFEFYSTHIIAANPDMVTKNYYIYDNPQTGQWEMMPWDLDLTFGDPAMSIDRGYGRNILYTRVLDIPQCRLAYISTLERLLDEKINDEIWTPFIEDLYQHVRFDGERDVFKQYAHDNEVFNRSPEFLPQRLTDRETFLREEIPAYAATIPWIWINEIGGPEPGSDEVPWVELVNGGPSAVDVTDYQLFADPELAPLATAPPTILAPDEFLRLDLTGSLPANSPLLEDLYLLEPAASGSATSDHVRYPAIAETRSWARAVDGWIEWATLPSTPGASNGLHRLPRLRDLRHQPTYPRHQDRIAVTVRVVETPVDQIRVTVRQGELETEIPLQDNGRSGDQLSGDGIFGAWIGRHDFGSTLEYRLSAYTKSGAVRHLPSADGKSWIRIDVDTGGPPVRLNEFMAANSTTFADEFGEYDDWVELVALDGSRDVHLDGFFLTDDPNELTKWKFPSHMVLSAGERIVLWCDNAPEQGDTHTNFKLNANGDFLAVVDRDGYTLIDSIDFGPQGTDFSHGRFPDRRGPWGIMFATPDAPNRREDQIGGSVTLSGLPNGGDGPKRRPTFAHRPGTAPWSPSRASMVPFGQKRSVSWDLHSSFSESPLFLGLYPPLGWLHLEPDADFCSLDESSVVDAVFDAAGMTPGTHRSWAWVEDAGGRRLDLPITMTVLPAGMFLEDSEECHEVLSGETGRSSLRLHFEPGSAPPGILANLEVRCAEDWIAPGPATVHPSTDAPTALAQLELLIDAEALAPGRHEGQVLIVPEAGPVFTVPVCAEVSAPVTFEGTPAAPLADALVVNRTPTVHRADLWAVEPDGARGPLEEVWLDPFEVRSLAEFMPGIGGRRSRCVRVGIAGDLIWDEICPLQ